MDLFLNISFAWIALILGIILSIIILLRVINKKYFNNKKNILYKINKALRKYHKSIGVTIIVVGLFHGLFSSENIFSFNFGTLTWIITIIIALTWIFKKHIKWMNWHRILTGLFIIVLVIHIIDVGGFIGIKNAYEIAFNKEKIEKEIIVIDKNQKYIDGIYEGVAQGYGPDLKIQLVIGEGEIANIVVLSHNEQNEQYYQLPIIEIPKAIIEQQSPYVDTISGATYTSIGIINATIDALQQAKTSDEILEPMAQTTGQKRGQGKNNH